MLNILLIYLSHILKHLYVRSESYKRVVLTHLWETPAVKWVSAGSQSFSPPESRILASVNTQPPSFWEIETL